MKTILRPAVAAAVVAALTACDSLSRQEERMLGDYYVPEVSDNVPLYELRADRSATVRKIVDGIEVSVNGRWRVEDDSLIVDTDRATLSTSGSIPPGVDISVAGRIARHIISYNEITLSLRHSDGLQYDYHRRYHAPADGE